MFVPSAPMTILSPRQALKTCLRCQPGQLWAGIPPSSIEGLDGIPARKGHAEVTRSIGKPGLSQEILAEKFDCQITFCHLLRQLIFSSLALRFGYLYVTMNGFRAENLGFPVTWKAMIFRFFTVRYPQALSFAACTNGFSPQKFRCCPGSAGTDTSFGQGRHSVLAEAGTLFRRNSAVFQGVYENRLGINGIPFQGVLLLSIKPPFQAPLNRRFQA